MANVATPTKFGPQRNKCYNSFWQNFWTVFYSVKRLFDEVSFKKLQIWLWNKSLIISYYKLKQWIASKACSDWLLKLRISFAIHLRATRVWFVPENIVIVIRMDDSKSSFRAVLTHRLSIYKTTIHLSVCSSQWMFTSLLHCFAAR